jgi:4-hydroxybenzoate polyprenyltransferase
MSSRLSGTPPEAGRPVPARDAGQSNQAGFKVEGRATTTATQRARNLNAIRRLGYAILPGDLFSYILHLRPAEWPIMAAHTAVGLLLATGLPTVATPFPWSSAIIGLFLWVVCLNGGTLAINSAFDNDEGDIGYLAAPPKPPRYLAAFALLLMATGQIAALRLGTPFAIAYAACFAMAILYSMPPFRWKAMAGADLIINMIGFGSITAYAGWTITGRPLESWALLLFLGFCPLFAALYPLTQLYQFEEDTRRGDRTLALVLGMRLSLQLAIGATILAFAIFAAAIAIGPTNRFWPTIVIPAMAWLLVLLPWYSRHQEMTPAEHQKGMYAALRAWAITDLAILATFAI